MAARYWIAALVRAVIALAAGAAITFDQSGHGAALGLVVFGLFGILEGLAAGFTALTLTDATSRTVQYVIGAIGLIAGIVALLTTGQGLGILLYTVSVWGLLTGVAELYLGLRGRRRLAQANDWTGVGTLTIVLAIVFLLIPADHLLAVGLFGAYAVLIGVYLAISAFSLRWSQLHPSDETTESHA